MTRARSIPTWARLAATATPARARDARSDRRALSYVALLYTALATLAVFTNGPIRYVADNRYEQYESPWRGLSRAFWTWDGTRGLGAPRDDVWIGTTLPVAVARSFGLSTAVAERSFHAGCLVLLGLGVVVLLRDFRPTVGAEHVVAGLLAMFNPFTASFLLPTNLFLMVAMCPWFVVVFHRGITGTRPWAWAAVFALLVLFAGNGDLPGLMYVGVVIIVVGCYSVIVDRSSTWTRVAGWLTRAVALSLATASWALVKTLGAADSLEARLVATELPSTSAVSSSWSESWRGLGNWLSYFREDGRPTKPQTLTYFDRPAVVLATFVVPVIALVVVWRARWRARLLFGVMMAVAIVLMVGGFAAPDAAPIGRGVLWLFEHNAVLTSLRNTYKAGGGFVIGASVLAAVGIVEVARAAQARSRAAGAVTRVLIGVVIITSAFPFAFGSLYHPDERVGSVPEYWHDAISYLDQLPEGGRSLIVPAVSQARYRWGYVGDDIFDALLNRPHATATGWMLSTRPGHAALDAITLAAQSPNYRPGVIGPMARRLGITEIVIRNDTDWRRINTARPIAFDDLRTDADLELVASFGPPGAGTTVYPLDASTEASAERELPAVEIYRVRDAEGLVSATVGRDDSVVVAGDAYSWPGLARASVLTDTTSLLASGALSDSDLEAELRDGGRIVVTDTERRRVLTLLHHEPQLSQTLAEDQVLDRPPRAVFADTPGAESVAWYADAVAITGSSVRLGGNRTDRRPALAFDGDPGTAWAVPSTGLAGPGARLEVTLRQPTRIGRFTILSTMSADGLPTVRRLEIELSDGSRVPVTVADDGIAEVSFSPQVTTTTIRVSVTQIESLDGEIGIAEIGVDDLDLVEYIRSPTDLTTRGVTTSDAVASTPTAYTFRRVARPISSARSLLVSSAYDEEVALNRRFDVTHDDRFDVSGTMIATAAASDEMIAVVVGSPVIAIGDRDPGAQIDGPAMLVLDGDPTTAWRGAARPEVGVTVRLPEQTLQRVSVSIPDDVGTARISKLRLEVAGRRYDATTQDPTCSGRGVLTCTRVATFTLPDDVVASSVRVSAVSIDSGGGFEPDQVRISEIEVVGDLTNGIDPSHRTTAACVDLGIRIGRDGGTGDAVLVRLDASIADVVSGRPVTFAACDRLGLTTGTYLLRTSPGSPVDELHLLPETWSRPAETAIATPVTWLVQSPDLWSGQVDTMGTVTVVSRMSFDPSWELVVDGQRIAAHERDGVNAWTFESVGKTSFDVEYAGARWLRRSLVLTFLGTAGSMLIVAGSVFGRRSAMQRAVVSPTVAPALTVERSPMVEPLGPSLRPSLDGYFVGRSRGVTAQVVALLLVPVLGLVIGGSSGFVAGAIITVLVRLFPVLLKVSGVAAPALLAAASVQSALLAGSVSILYPRERWAPSTLARLAMVFLLATSCFAIGLERIRREDAPVQVDTATAGRHEGRSRPSQRRVRSWVLVCCTAIASGAAAAVRPDREGVPAALVRNVRLGIGFTMDGVSGPVARRTPPLPAVLAAFAPGRADVFVFLAVAATVALVALLAREWSHGSTAAATRAGLLVAVVLGLWGPALPAAVALVLATAAAWVVDRSPGMSSPCVAGLLVGAAVLAQPAALLALFVVVWRLAQRRIDDLVSSSVVTVVAAWLVSAPWLAALVRDDGILGLVRQLSSLTWMLGFVAAALGTVSSGRRRGMPVAADRHLARQAAETA